ncbi:hypothetical protein EMIHUDRAFT_243881 [Emiliania huxleyi CCMP1516]|uniref:Uncharacterized protein n=2 Tax=Emiliania huxleyi TaxID=2903 RepID=A0A0D3J2A5_EMIH1|nr:hypothetical protein EMIHUDRAFT_243881 [Emiliania huxleyi CCMP1516]EOD17640.1 hypothetical protein EMIHUDRAFT_243881 [Emiliania huxleyi CCMP1516]|eukprot:XP_005770069.1 hypothetical protein EMIHUDRAFT_243881 [Emiliania huxleyi CCMP1516]
MTASFWLAPGQPGQLLPIPNGGAAVGGAVVEQRLAAFAGNAAPRHTDSLLPEPVN